MNYGSFVGDEYIKKVVFSKAVLWHTRELSLRRDIMDKIRMTGIKRLIFIDELKGEKWIFKWDKVFIHRKLKQVGQEQQYYFPIDIAKKEKIAKVKPVFDFDNKTNTAFVKGSRDIEPTQQKLV